MTTSAKVPTPDAGSGVASVRLGVFSPSVVLGVAASGGALSRAGLHIDEVPATSSSQQFADLADGRLDAVLTSPDNVLAYRASADNPLRRQLDVTILAAVDRGLGLSLFGAPGIDSATRMRGGVLAVDVPTSGFAFVAYELLARLGLARGVDYTVRALGTTPKRASALSAGQCQMTVLNAGNDLRAEAAGCPRITRACTLGPYLGTVLATSRATLARATDLIGRLTGVVVSTSTAILRGELAELAAAETVRRLGLDPAGTGRYLATLADPAEGLIGDGRCDQDALATLCRLRHVYGDGGPDLSTLVAPGSGLLDERFLPRR
ncbi:MAG TPA: hypothetical protein VH561_06150 [Micromonosporaceae bacterium]|jgi:ABC-type nitrate/sulfonate/bicarbonate transport system substrate-binding protein